MNKIKTINEVLFKAACSGDLKTLKNYYEEGGELNRRHEAFGHCNSLIAGAFRNGQTETVEYLCEVGETLLEAEKEEIKLPFYYPYSVWIEKESGAVETMEFRTKENAFIIYHVMLEIAVQQAEKIVIASIHKENKMLKETHF